MLERIDRLSVVRTVVLALAIGVLVVAADILTGEEVSFSVFYVIPTALVAWRLGRASALGAAVLAALAWFVVELLGDREYSQPLIPYWNGIVRLAFFGIIAALIVTIRDALREQSENARVDTLTGLLNRRGFDERAQVELERAQRSKRPMTVATFDIDHFKQLNDTAGHAAGDEVLRQVGLSMHAALRRVDVIGRLGGDEFAMLLPETNDEHAHLVIERLHERLMKITADSRIGFSVGAVTFQRPPHSIDLALGRADQLMYAAKGDARGGIRYAIDTPSASVPPEPRHATSSSSASTA